MQHNGQAHPEQMQKVDLEEAQCSGKRELDSVVDRLTNKIVVLCQVRDVKGCFKHFKLREGVRKKNTYFLWSFAKPPLGPPPAPPRYGLFTDKKIYTHFFLEIESMIAKTNFTLGPIEKSIFLVQL